MLESWFKLDDKIRYIFVGGFNFCVSYLIYALLCHIFGSHFYQWALALSWMISSVISFTTQKWLVFKGGNNWFQEYIKCCSTWAISYIINALLLEILVKHLAMNVYLSQFIATSTVAVLTYVLFKKFAFKNKK